MDRIGVVAKQAALRASVANFGAAHRDVDESNKERDTANHDEDGKDLPPRAGQNNVSVAGSG